MVNLGGRRYALALLVLASACQDRELLLAKERAQKNVVERVPANARVIGTLLGDKLELLAIEEQRQARYEADTVIKYRLYWRLSARLEHGYHLFTHVYDETGGRLANLSKQGALREHASHVPVLPPDEFEPGKVYVDEQSYRVPRGLTSRRLDFVVGAAKDQSRLPVVRGPRHSPDSVLATRIELYQAPPPLQQNTRLPAVVVPYVLQAPKIDGFLKEPEWRAAPLLGPFVKPSNGLVDRNLRVQATANLLYDDTYLYVAANVRDANVEGNFGLKSRDAMLWKQDAFALLFDPDGDNRDYYEVQVNPQGLVFDTVYDSYNKPVGPPDKGPFGHQEWDSGVIAAVKVQGTVSKPGDKDEGYTIELKLPWKRLTKVKRVPPAPGDVWRLNLYALEHNDGVAWSAILGRGNFHKVERFGEITFAAKPGAKAASPAPRKPTPPTPRPR